MRTINKETTQKYLNFLHSLKYKLDNENHYHIRNILDEHKVSTNWLSFLLKNNVIYKETSIYPNFYCWNKKIPVSVKLIQKFREFKYKQYEEYKKSKNFKLNNQTKIVFDKKEIKKTTLPNVEKTKIEKFTHVKTQKEIGVIRKFLRWLW
jgi:hypothetical protein